MLIAGKAGEALLGLMDSERRRAPAEPQQGTVAHA